MNPIKRNESLARKLPCWKALLQGRDSSLLLPPVPVPLMTGETWGRTDHCRPGNHCVPQPHVHSVNNGHSNCSLTMLTLSFGCVLLIANTGGCGHRWWAAKGTPAESQTGWKGCLLPFASCHSQLLPCLLSRLGYHSPLCHLWLWSLQNVSAEVRPSWSHRVWTQQHVGCHEVRKLGVSLFVNSVQSKGYSRQHGFLTCCWIRIIYNDWHLTHSIWSNTPSLHEEPGQSWIKWRTSPFLPYPPLGNFCFYCVYLRDTLVSTMFGFCRQDHANTSIIDCYFLATKT